MCADSLQLSAEPVHSVARLLLSHHPPVHGHRTVKVACGPWEWWVCARCLGLTLGVLSSSILSGCGLADRIPAWIMVTWLLAAPGPALVDFHGQLVGSWESTNARRIVTGVLFGTGVGLCVGQAVGGGWAPAAILPSVLAVYLGWVLRGRRRAVRLLRHLRLYEAYFERCRAEDARRAVGKATRGHPHARRLTRETGDVD